MALVRAIAKLDRVLVMIAQASSISFHLSFYRPDVVFAKQSECFPFERVSEFCRFTITHSRSLGKFFGFII